LTTLPGPPSSHSALDSAVARVRDAAPAWARLPIAARAEVAAAMWRGAARTAERSVAAACAAKSIDPGSATAGEEWMSGPYVTLRMLRQLVQSLEALSRGRPPPVGELVRRGAQLAARVFPADALDEAVYRFVGLDAEVRFVPGASGEEISEAQAHFHHHPHGGRTCAVLGAGNINSIPTTDVLTKMFVEGATCVLKPNPLNAYLGPILEEAFADAIAAGWLAVVHGGADEGAYLAHHAGIDAVHVTGSVRTHDALVWGAPGAERAARVDRGEPLLAKELTSELGNVTPVIVVPGPYGERDLAAQAENVAGMVVHNASFNCVSAKLLVLPRGWPQRDRFLRHLCDALARVPPRAAWYPGAEARWAAFVEGRRDVRASPPGPPGTLPWAVVAGLDPDDAAEPAFCEEAFCAVLGETAVGSDDPVEFLPAAVRFVNERVLGTLSAAIVVHPECQRGSPGAALDEAIRELRYGTVCVNAWPGAAFGACTTPWGAFPGSTPTAPRSGSGFVHNSRMLGLVEKTLMRAPLRPFVKLPYLPGHRNPLRLGRSLVALEATGSWAKLAPVFAAALAA
jgi:acyl-CoA reductase-like NAD-dependent aldehyde dehydrogenase